MKQYLLVCDENTVGMLQGFFNGINVQFLEVQGIHSHEQNRYNVLVNPTYPIETIQKVPLSQ